MKFGFLHITCIFSLLLGTAPAWANDVSCQVDLLKPKFNAAMIEEESSKPAQLTVSETQQRLQQKIRNIDTDKSNKKQQAQETAQTSDEKRNDKATKKPSRLGGLFEILLPSKLRNPVK